jgi:CRISPR-associated protein Cas5h
MNMEQNIIASVDFKASFGFLKKNDINDSICLTYNCLHKPALLGIFGAILGLGGYYQAFINKSNVPEYIDKLKDFKVGIEPLNSSNGNFKKTVITYNNSVGYANKEKGGNLIIKEQTLIAPKYRVYFLLNNEYANKLFNMLKNKEAVYIPYLGKNDFQLTWEEPKEYTATKFEYTSHYSINSIFRKNDIIKNNLINDGFDDFSSETQNIFFYFERLPIGFSKITGNYELEEFVYTNAVFSNNLKIDKLYELIENNNSENSNKTIVQLI